MFAHDPEELATVLPGALRRGEVIAHFQPQFDLASFRVVAAEALARWAHPDLGLLAPSEFIPLAEDSGVISEIGSYMLREAGRQVAAWRADGLEWEVSVNVSILEVSAADYSDGLLAILGDCGADPSWITLEITETRAVDDLEALNRHLSSARAAGVTISIDDFGIGHSTFDRARRLEASELKIDRSTIQSAEDSLGEVLDVIHEARSSGIRLVAEGIETRLHLQRAITLGCERGQGYLLGQPVAAAELRRLLG